MGLALVLIFLGIPALLCLGFAFWILYHNIFHNAGLSAGMVIMPLILGVMFSLFCFMFIQEEIEGPTTYYERNEQIVCGVCGREFRKGSENARSIRRTNMCTQCYNNYKAATDYLNELPVN